MSDNINLLDDSIQLPCNMLQHQQVYDDIVLQGQSNLLAGIQNMGQKMGQQIQNPAEQRSEGSNQKSKSKKATKKSSPDYRKNICGYITKKIIRQFLGDEFHDTVQNIFNKKGADVKKTKQFYQNIIEKVTGPSHIPELINAKTIQQVPLKQTFKQFFEWFLTERYIRYLINEGKMKERQVYIRYKNQVLYHILKSQPQENIQTEQKKTKNQTKTPRKNKKV